ncbi:Uncharacterized protein FKW44_006161, partial [Caligus rogercresseyi]
ITILIIEQKRRDAVLELFQAGHGAQDIIKLLHYPKFTVYDIIKRVKANREYSRKVHNSRSDRISLRGSWLG